MARYESVDGSAERFWDIRVDGLSVVTTWGRLGSAGQTSSRAFDSAVKAKKEHDKLVAEKVRKGYRQVGVASRDEDDIDTVVTSALPRPTKS